MLSQVIGLVAGMVKYSSSWSLLTLLR